MRVAAVCWLILAGCSSGETRVEPSRTIDLPGLGLRIDAPEDTEMVARADGVDLTLRPRTRHPMSLLIAAGAGAAAPAFTVRSSDAGMGGEQHELRGTVTIAGRSVEVRCTEVREDGADLEWCLAALASLRPAR